MTNDTHHACQCPCGKTAFTVRATPFLRFYCHCLICQELYKQPYVDVTVVKSQAVLLNSSGVTFKKYRLPPALQRGTCNHCHKPVAGFLTGVPGLKLAFITGDNFIDKTNLPDSVGHIFYHRKANPVDDALPKISGYWKSEATVAKWLLPHLMG